MTDQVDRRGEVFQYTDEAGNDQWLAIEPLRRWAEENCELRSISIDFDKVEDMLASGKIDDEHLRQHTIQHQPRPVIVCEDFRGIASEIVDGNHTYVAMAAAIVFAKREGVQLPGSPGVLGYVVSRAQMEQFLIPPELRPETE